MREYVVKRVKYVEGETIWSEIPTLGIDCYQWEDNGYKPEVKAAVCYDEAALHIRFTAWEDRIKVKGVKYCDSVYKDSCVEFFFNPAPDRDNRYLNFEMNAAGVLLLGIGSDRGDWRYLYEVNPSIFNIKSSVKMYEVEAFKGPFWQVEYTIPFEFIEKYYGNLDITSGMQLRANFYKCGDDTEYPHYGSWNPIEIEEADFHRPDYFGKLILG